MLAFAPSDTLRSMSSHAVAGLPASDVARDNDAWVRAIAEQGAAGQAAQRDLRHILVRGLRSILSSRGVAEDMCEDFAQEALVRIRERLPGFRGESRFTTWALSIATRIAFDELRHKRWKDVSLEAASAAGDDSVALASRAPSSEEKRLLRERIASTLRDAIDNNLTDRQRAALLATLDGVPVVETARALGIDRNALYKLTHDARQKVKRHLDEAGVSVVDVLWAFE